MRLEPGRGPVCYDSTARAMGSRAAIAGRLVGVTAFVAGLLRKNAQGPALGGRVGAGPGIGCDRAGRLALFHPPRECLIELLRVAGREGGSRVVHLAFSLVARDSA